MAERERALAPPYGGVFVARTTVMEAEEVRRATWRMAHEVIERNHDLGAVVVVGLQTAVPVEHAVTPFLHALPLGLQGWLAVHAPH